MTPLFADTFFLIAALAKNDEAHAKARQLLQNLTSPVVTTTWVLIEVGDALAAPQKRNRFVDLLDFLDNHRLITVVPPDQQQFAKAVALYRNRPDKAWSLTDCTSFIIMQERGIREALTGDHHFEQAGFVALLK